MGRPRKIAASPPQRPAPAAAPGFAPAPTGASATPAEEREALNELARQQYAERFGENPAEVTPTTIDPGSAEAMRDRALQAHFQKKQRIAREERERRRQRAERQRMSASPELAGIIATVPGVGPAKQAALLSRFPTADVLADASVDDIAAVPGIGPTLAERIKNSVG